MKSTPIASREAEMPAQRQESRRDGRYNRSRRPRPWPSVDSAAPEPGVHGRIADGSSPDFRLERRMCWSAGGDAGRRSVL